MSDRKFLDAYDQTLQHIETVIDDQGQALDYENQGGMLTIFCPNGSQVIITRQTPTQELWLAAQTGGFHFSLLDSGQWHSTRDEIHLKQRLEEVVFLQSNECLAFDL